MTRKFMISLQAPHEECVIWLDVIVKEKMNPLFVPKYQNPPPEVSSRKRGLVYKKTNGYRAIIV